MCGGGVCAGFVVSAVAMGAVLVSAPSVGGWRFVSSGVWERCAPSEVGERFAPSVVEERGGPAVGLWAVVLAVLTAWFLLIVLAPDLLLAECSCR